MLNENEEFLRRLGAMAAKVDAITNCNDLSCVNADHLALFRSKIPPVGPFLRAEDWAAARCVARLWMAYWLGLAVCRLGVADALQKLKTPA